MSSRLQRTRTCNIDSNVTSNAIFSLHSIQRHASVRRCDRNMRGVASLPALQAAMADASRRCHNPDGILLTGDLVQDDPAGYRWIRQVFGASKVPVHVPGRQSRSAGSHARRTRARALPGRRRERVRPLAGRHARHLGRARRRRRIGRQATRAPARSADANIAISTCWSACIIIRSRCAASGSIRSAWRMPTSFLSIVRAARECARRAVGPRASIAGQLRARRALHGVARHLRAVPARQRPISRSTIVRRAIACSSCMPDGSIATEVVWLESYAESSRRLRL